VPLAAFGQVFCFLDVKISGRAGRLFCSKVVLINIHRFVPSFSLLILLVIGSFDARQLLIILSFLEAPWRLVI